jgi:hypothetical protein
MKLDLSEFAQSQLLAHLVKLIWRFKRDGGLHHAIGNAIAQILDQAECESSVTADTRSPDRVTF